MKYKVVILFLMMQLSVLLLPSGNRRFKKNRLTGSLLHSGNRRFKATNPTLALKEAIISGNLKAAQAAIANGADLNAKIHAISRRSKFFRNDLTCHFLHLIVQYGRYQLITYFRSANVNFEIQNAYFNKTPLDIAFDYVDSNSREDIIRTIQALVDAGASIDRTEGTYERFPLDLAIRKNFPEVVKIFLNANATVSDRLIDQAPLFYDCNINSEIMVMLTAAHALQNKKNHLILDIARKYYQTESDPLSKFLSTESGSNLTVALSTFMASKQHKLPITCQEIAAMCTKAPTLSFILENIDAILAEYNKAAA